MNTNNNLPYYTYINSCANKMTDVIQENVSGPLSRQNQSYLKNISYSCCRTSHEITVGTLFLSSCCGLSVPYSLILLGSNRYAATCFEVLSERSIQKIAINLETINSTPSLEKDVKEQLEEEIAINSLTLFAGQISASYLAPCLPNFLLNPSISCSESLCLNGQVLAADWTALVALQLACIICPMGQENITSLLPIEV